MMTARDDAAGPPDLYISGVQPDIGPVTFQMLGQGDLNSSSISPRKRETWLFEMPLMPMVWTRTSTERVETP
jgi:hypothetical protein